MNDNQKKNLKAKLLIYRRNYIILLQNIYIIIRIMIMKKVIKNENNPKIHDFEFNIHSKNMK